MSSVVDFEARPHRAPFRPYRSLLPVPKSGRSSVDQADAHLGDFLRTAISAMTTHFRREDQACYQRPALS